ncbi:hypothetical protein LZG74_08925 [Dyadobacter sp. CY327]|uniref:hypothetical protein n=1 Tax=Dyadobacter sp. CY327 TaxID=2907301 RepID=UPI001F39F6EA|nr:hypothetical protein [Dyadobacter sp. CY327]MCE7070423.1 hypothetical protein [Dyadobacter sp. CY327]
MRLILLLFIMIAFVHVQAQFAPNYQEEIERISQMEQKGFQRRLNGDLANARTSASQNFDVKYYRCEWEVDSAVRYIKGVVNSAVTVSFPVPVAGGVTDSISIYG